MKKNKAIIVLLVMVLLLGGLSYTAVEGIGTEKAGAASGIKLGLDLAGGVSITYQVVGEENPSKEDMADTIYKLQKRVEKYSTEAQVYPMPMRFWRSWANLVPCSFFRKQIRKAA